MFDPFSVVCVVRKAALVVTCSSTACHVGDKTLLLLLLLLPLLRLLLLPLLQLLLLLLPLLPLPLLLLLLRSSTDNADMRTNTSRILLSVHVDQRECQPTAAFRLAELVVYQRPLAPSSSTTSSSSS